MPTLTILRTILGRIGGWLMLAVGAVAWLWVRDRQAERRGADEVRREQETRNAQAMVEAVEISSRDRDAGARDELRRRHTRAE